MKTINTMRLSQEKAGFLRFWPIALMFMAVLVFGAWAPMASAWNDRDDWDDEEEIPFDVADIYFELNNTDGDLGIHALIDGDAWKYLAIEDPRGRKMLNIFVRGRLHRQGLTELFFESAEPTFDELAPEKFFLRFPEGEYEIEGITLDREERESTDFLTHLLPAPPGGIVVSRDTTGIVVISWDPVTLSHPDLGRKGEPIDVVNYQVVVEVEVEVEVGGEVVEKEMIYSVHLPPNVGTISVPPEFIELGDEFKFEILVREESGNQTAIEGSFAIDDLDN